MIKKSCFVVLGGRYSAGASSNPAIIDSPTGDIASLMPKWAAYENCPSVVIPNAKHFAIRDDAPLFTRVLLEFLDRWTQ